AQYQLDDILHAQATPDISGSQKQQQKQQQQQQQKQQLELVAAVQTGDCRWRLQQIQLTGLSDCSSLLALLTPQLEAAAGRHRRPRSLLVFVNPVSGGGGAVRLCDRLLRPALRQCRVAARRLTALLGRRRGDGILSELFHGLLLRKRLDEGLTAHTVDDPELRPDHTIGIVPAGSTDTVVHSINGTSDALTAIVQIILGRRVAMDMASVYSDSGQFLTYNISLLGYGYFGEVARSSEPLRWMGPARYDLVGAHRLLNLRSHALEISFLEADGRCHAVCTRDCSVCSSDALAECAPEAKEQQRRQLRTVTGRFVAVNSFLMPCRSTKSAAGAVPFAHLGDGCTDLVLVRDCSKAEFLRHLYRVSSCPVRLSTAAAGASAIDDSLPPPPPTPPAPVEPQFQLDCVQCASFPCAFWTIRPGPCGTATGEVLRQAGLAVRVHRQLLQLFGCHVTL
uniref:DAGKc domain-containing protein n=1 Tax=Macrostomum lignano TaxID=282301 RepID=A0A1I8IPS7_9PLAT